MKKSDNACSLNANGTTTKDESVTTVISKQQVAPQDDTLDAWFDRVAQAHKRMATDEEYRKKVAKGIS